MNDAERRLLENLHSYQRHLGQALVECLSMIVETSKSNAQIALTLSAATAKLGESVDRLETLEQRIGSYINDQAKQDSNFRAHLERYHHGG